MKETGLVSGAKQGQPFLFSRKPTMGAACPWDPKFPQGPAWRKGASAGILGAPADRRA